MCQSHRPSSPTPRPWWAQCPQTFHSPSIANVSASVWCPSSTTPHPLLHVGHQSPQPSMPRLVQSTAASHHCPSLVQSKFSSEHSDKCRHNCVDLWPLTHYSKFIITTIALSKASSHHISSMSLDISLSDECWHNCISLMSFISDPSSTIQSMSS
jgi:hypothetical protein